MRCAMKAAWLLASFSDEHSWPMKSRARISPTKSKKNRFMTRIKSRTVANWLLHGSPLEDDFNRTGSSKRANRSSVNLFPFHGPNCQVGKPQPVPDPRAPRDLYRMCCHLLRFLDLHGLTGAHGIVHRDVKRVVHHAIELAKRPRIQGTSDIFHRQEGELHRPTKEAARFDYTSSSK
jgi:hypothetical protein